MSVRARLFLLLLALSVLPILVLRLNAQHNWQEISGVLVHRIQRFLVEKAKSHMRMMVEDHAELWRRESVLMEQTLRLQALEVEKSLSPSAGPPGSLDAAYANSSRLAGGNVLGQVTVLADGRLFASNRTALDQVGYDGRESSWYRLSSRESGPVWSAPETDPSTRLLVFTISMGIRDASGRLLGVTALLTPLALGEQSRLHAASVSSRLKTYLVDFTRPDSQEKGPRVIGVADPPQDSLAHGQAAPGMGAPGVGRGMGMNMGMNMKLNMGMAEIMKLHMGIKSQAGAVWITPDDHAELELMLSELKHGQSDVRQAALGGKDYIWAYAPSGVSGLALVLVAPKSDVTADATLVAKYIESSISEELQETLYLLLCALTAIALSAWLVSRSVTRPILDLSQATQRLGRGDFTSRVEPSGGREMVAMGQAFNAMVPQLADHTRLIQAMSLAREVNRRLLPAELPALPGLDLAAATIACEEVGGDSYDVFSLGHGRGGRAAALVGDVSGHGLDAALLMATARAFLRMRALQSGSPAEVVTDVNRFLAQDTVGSGRFMTLFYIELSPDAREIRWVRAGHDPAILYRPATDSFEELAGPGIPLGVTEDRVFGESSRPWPAPGEVLLVGSDGLWEARGEDGGMFGKERVRELMRQNSGLAAKGIMDAILDALDVFRGSSPAEDDVTLLVIKAG